MQVEKVKKVERTRNQRLWNRFITIFLLLHIPLFVYPVLRLSVWLGFPFWFTSLIIVPLVGSQIISRIYLRSNGSNWARRVRKTSDFWLGISPILLMSLLVFEVVVLFTPLKPHIAGLSVLGISMFMGFIALLFAITPYVKTIRLTSPNLSKPVRFVQITDVHIGSRSCTFLEKIIFRINRLNPDFLCITGDFIDSSGIEEDQLQSLRSVTGPVYFCIGNHEKYEDLPQILERLQNLGIKVLRDQGTHYRDDIQVLGIDDDEDPLQVEKRLTHMSVDSDCFKLLLYHRPQGLEAAADAGIDLMISGHTHNGQIFPSNLIVGRVFERIVGMYQLGQSRQYVSQGTGTWGPPMRLGTRAEITLFECYPE